MSENGNRRRTFRLTEERKGLLGHLVRYRYLRTSHFYSLYGAGTAMSERAVRRLLHDFHWHGYLRRHVGVTDQGRGALPRYEYVYGLSPTGVALSRDCGLSDGDPPPMPASTRTLTHDILITDFHFKVERFSAGVGWTVFWQQHGLKRTVNPDAIFALTDPRRGAEETTAYYFLEIERARETGYEGGRSGLIRRLERYAAYQGSAACLRDWRWFDEFRVILVVATETRRWGLLQRLSKTLPLEMFWICTEGADLGTAAFRSPADYDRESSFLD